MSQETLLPAKTSAQFVNDLREVLNCLPIPFEYTELYLPESAKYKNRLKNEEINLFLNKYLTGEKKSQFLGVFPRDEVAWTELKVTYPWSVIINLDEANGPGLHFVVLIKTSSSKLFYFDSLGLHKTILPSYFVEKLEELTCKSGTEKVELWEAPFPIQSVRSNACGYFVIWFIILWNNLDDRKFTSTILNEIFARNFKRGMSSILFRNEEYIISSILQMLCGYRSVHSDPEYAFFPGYEIKELLEKHESLRK